MKISCTAVAGGQLSWEQQSIQSPVRENDLPFGSLLINGVVGSERIRFWECGQRLGSYLDEGLYGYDRKKYLEVLCEAFEPCSWPLGPPTMRPDGPKTHPALALHQLTLRSGRACSCKLKE
jgi:hypothetical protein